MTLGKAELLPRILDKLVDPKLIQVVTSGLRLAALVAVVCGAVLTVIAAQGSITDNQLILALCVCFLLLVVIVLAIGVRRAPRIHFVDSRPRLRRIRFWLEVVSSRGFSDGIFDKLLESHDRRRLKRVCVALPFQVTLIGTDGNWPARGTTPAMQQIATTMDVSGAGTAVLLSAAVSPGDFAYVEALFENPSESRKFIARVISVRQTLGQQLRCGLEFLTKERQVVLLSPTLLQQLPQKVREFDDQIAEQINEYLLARYGLDSQS